MKNVAVIMAGGYGERFWPLSRMSNPKQLLYLTNPNKFMLEEAIDRISDFIPVEDIFIITNEMLQPLIRTALPNMPAQNIVAEPAKRNTAPCLALASSIIKAKYEPQGIKEDSITMSVLTADHLIRPKADFIKTVKEAIDTASEGKYLVTIGINPYRPETGYGYIEIGDKVIKSNEQIKTYNVSSFKEKPDHKLAEKYVESGEYLWNSGMFFWRLDLFNKEMKKAQPVIGDSIITMEKIYKWNEDVVIEGANILIKPVFEKLESISIDYALMEKANNVAVVKADFEWDDIGTWNALERIQDKDDNGNITKGDVTFVKANSNFVLNNSSNKEIVLLGVKDMIVVETEDATLISTKESIEDIRMVIEEMKKKGLKRLL